MELFIDLIIHILHLHPEDTASPERFRHKSTVCAFSYVMPCLLRCQLNLLSRVHFVFSRGHFGLIVLLANQYNSPFRFLPNCYTPFPLLFLSSPCCCSFSINNLFTPYSCVFTITSNVPLFSLPQTIHKV